MLIMFGKAKEEREIEQMQNLMDKYHLEELSPNDLEIVKRITSDLVANGFAKASMAMGMASVPEQAKVTYLSALVEQNWMMINQLSRINSNIEKLLNK